MRPSLILAALALAATTSPAASRADDRPRLLILTDIGGDPDDQQSMVRLMLYANEFRIEGLIASAAGTPGELDEAVTKPQLIREIVEVYGKVLPNLKKHAEGWPEAGDLASKIKSGNPQRGRDFIGQGHQTEGSREIIRLVDAGSSQDKLNICVWGGQSDLAQALWNVKTDGGEQGYREFIAKFRVYDISDQDHIAAWMRVEFPGMFYILAKAPDGENKVKGTYRGMYLTGDESLTSPEWIQRNIKSISPLGALYPMKTWTSPNPHSCMKEGDTPAWFFFLPLGGNDAEDPTKPGWGGQFRQGDDGWFVDLEATPDFDPRSTVSRWRPDYQADFARRMSWTE